jgi:hypothetical protein
VTETVANVCFEGRVQTWWKLRRVSPSDVRKSVLQQFLVFHPLAKIYARKRTEKRQEYYDSAVDDKVAALGKIAVRIRRKEWRSLACSAENHVQQ